MHKVIAAMSLLGVAFAPTASAQDNSRGKSAQGFISHCVAMPEMSRFSVPEPACACLLGHYSARMNDRQLAIMSAVAPYLSDGVPGSAVELLIRDGYNREEVEVVAGIVADVGDLPVRTCSILER